MRLFLSLSTVLVLACAAYAAEWHDIPGGRWSPLVVPVSGHTGFSLLNPTNTAVVFTNKLRAADGAQNRTFYNGSGVATGDFDGDGRPDIALVGIEGRLSLFRNLGDWRFADVTAESGAVATNLMARAVVLADITGDGALDLMISANRAGVHCWRNDGHGHFTDITATAGIAGRHGSLTMALADVDGDGTLDLYVANNRTEDIRDTGVGQVQLGMLNGELVIPAALANRLGLNNGKIFEYGEPDELWLNDGAGRFHAASWTDGRFLEEAGLPLRSAPLDWGLTATFRDLNDDGAPDLYVCNDYWTPDRLWFNDGHGRFRAAPALALRQTSGSSMGVDVADVDSDGLPDIFVVDMLSRLAALRKRQTPAQSDSIRLPGRITDRPQSLRNTLQIARGDGTYAEVAGFAGLTGSEWAWQPIFMDVDLDGRPDLLITTGHMRDVQDRDAAATIQARERNYGSYTNSAERRKLFVGDRVANLSVYPPLNTAIVAFRNRGDLTFEDVTADWGTDQPGVHHGIAMADFDGDGDLDFVVNNLNGPAALYRNESATPRVAVRLRGLGPNTQAVGSTVTLRGGAIPEQRQEVVAGGRYLSGSDPLLVFAAGTNSTSMTLDVRWRNGTHRELRDIQPGRLYEFLEDPALDIVRPLSKLAPVDVLFSDVTERLSHSHAEILFDDFERQPLLTRRLSQAGPGVAWLDWDGDGWEDLAIGGSSGGALSVFRNDQQGGFALATNLPTARDQVALAAIGRQLFIAESNYEDAQVDGTAVRFVEAGKVPTAILPASTNAVGAITLGDFDGDGDLDLFVGGGVVPGRWPEPATSVLLRNAGGHFTELRRFDRLGLVTSALWTDLTGDGFPELAIACEWGSVTLFRNDHGQLTPWNPEVDRAGARAAKPVRLSALTGWWSGLAAGDFDGDGRLDLVAANWGLNSEHQACLERPAVLVAGDWAGTDSLGLIETTFDPVRGALTPTRPLPDLLSGLPFLAGRFPSHRAFSEATLDEVLGPQRAKGRQFEVIELRSLVLLNRGDRFEARELPLAAQLAPALTPVVTDFDGDGDEDIFLSQNFFATRPSVPRLDAGRGLLLRGDGRGGFAAIPGHESGVLVYGEQRGAATADYDHDGRADLVVTQNGGATRLFHNANARPGLRIRLTGPPGNPEGIGAVVRLRAGDFTGPVRELHAGSGVGSQGSAGVVLTIQPGAGAPSQLMIRWPGGQDDRVAIPLGSTEIRVQPAAAR
ncbi:MAG: hypothetical protein EXS36_06380 [Pedosphaera sp.]|nr:hypothetical protein [Pedosphaera sp.]